MFGNPEKFDKSWRDICEVKPAGADQLREMIKYHYLHKWPAVQTLSLALWCGPFVLGMCIFSEPPKETSKRYGGYTWELARLWIRDDVPRNAETWLISRSIKHIKKNNPEVEFIVSYADPSVGHVGTIYKAANFTNDGMTDDDRKSPRCDYMVNGKTYSRKSQVPQGSSVTRVPRVSKYRYYYNLIR